MFRSHLPPLVLAAALVACGGLDAGEAITDPAVTCATGFTGLDFETPGTSAALATWSNGGVPRTTAAVSGPGAKESLSAAVVELFGNDGSGPGGWSGGGMVVPLSVSGSIDLTRCANLVFDVRMVGDLGATRLKLEDRAGSDTYERPLSEFVSLGGTWATATVPLAAFRNGAGNPEAWRPVDLTVATALVTVLAADGSTHNGDGSPWLGHDVLG